jgi:hypothetical protein
MLLSSASSVVAEGLGPSADVIVVGSALCVTPDVPEMPSGRYARMRHRLPGSDRRFACAVIRADGLKDQVRYHAMQIHTFAIFRKRISVVLTWIQTKFLGHRYR